MKSKKGVTLVGMIIGLVCVAIFIYIFFHPEQLLARVSNPALKLGDEILGNIQKEQVVKPEEPVPVPVLKVYNSLLEEFKKEKQPGKCLIYKKDLTTFEGSFENHFIRIIKLRDNRLRIMIHNPKGQTLEGYSEIVEGVVPCAVAGEKESKHFFENWIKKPLPTEKEDKDYSEFSTVFILRPEGQLGPEKKGLSFGLVDEEGRGTGGALYEDLLYQADQNHVCFIPTANRVWCKVPKEPYYVISDECINDIEENIPTCSYCASLPQDQCSTDPRCRWGVTRCLVK